MKTLVSVLILMLCLVGPAQGFWTGRIGLYGDTGSGLSRTIEPAIGIPFDIVANVDEVLVMAAAEFVMTDLAMEYPGVFKLATFKVNNTPLDPGDNARGEYVLAFGGCVRENFEAVRVTYLDIGGFVGSDAVLSLRGFEAGDTQPSSFNNRMGFIDCIFTGGGKHLLDVTTPGLITGSGAYAPPGAMVVNATQPVVEEDTSTWFSLDFDPDTLNLSSKGRKVSIALSESGPRSIYEIDLGSLELMGAPVLNGSAWIDDSANPPVLWAKFPRAEVADMLDMGMNVEVTLSGETADGSVFTSTAEINVIDPKNSSPARVAASVAPGSFVTVEWRAIYAEHDTDYTGYISMDGGATWSQVFAGVRGTNKASWTLDPALVGDAQLLIEGRHPLGFQHHAVAAKFLITPDAQTRTAEGGRTELSATASPNPFNPNTTIHFSLPVSGNADLVIYDLAGRKVKTLASGYLEAGDHQVPWNGRDDTGRQVASGTYVYQLRAGAKVHSNRMVLLK
jgi:hypothetical protein